MTDQLSRFKSALEISTGLAVLLAVVGYISLRSSLNHLGVTGVGNFPAGLYLFEAYVIVVAAAAALAIPAAILFVLVVAVWSLQGFKKGQVIYDAASAFLQKPSLLAALIILSPILAVIFWSILQSGPEDTQILLRPTATLIVRPRRPEMFILPTCAALALVALSGSRGVMDLASQVLGERLTRASRVACGLGAFIMLWWAITNFNIYVRELQFPVAAALGKDLTMSACGLLVLSTDEIHVLWQPGRDAPEHRGRFEHVRRSELAKIVVGERMRIDDANMQSRLLLHCVPGVRA